MERAGIRERKAAMEGRKVMEGYEGKEVEGEEKTSLQFTPLT